MFRSILSLLFLSGAALGQTVWYVNQAASPPGSGTRVSPYASIQFAIEQLATRSGDTIRVAPGTYFELIDFSGKSLRLESDAGPLVTLLVASGMDSIVKMVSGEGPGTVLNGFTVKGTDAPVDGGGVQCLGATVRIENCVVTENFSAVGGGISGRWSALEIVSSSIHTNVGFWSAGVYVSQSSLYIEDSTIVMNTSIHSAAISATESDVTILDSVIRDNAGDGVFCDGGELSLIRCEISGHTSLQPGAGVRVLGAPLSMRGCRVLGNRTSTQGGGVHTDSPFEIVDTLFRGNVAARGGAFAALSHGFLRGCTFEENQALWGGGGAVLSAFTNITRCVFDRNQAVTVGGGIHSTAATRLNHSTFHENSAGEGGAVYGVAASNSIFWNNLPDQLDPASTAQWSDVQGGFPGTGNIDADPFFEDPAAGRFELLALSPCIDAGDPLSPADADGSRADMGRFTFAAAFAPFCASLPNSTGAAATLDATGSSSIGINDLTLHVASVPAFSIGAFLASTQATVMPFGDGNLCAAAPQLRIGPPQVATPAGTLAFGVDLGSAPLNAITPFSTWYFQVLYRDLAGGPAGFNLSDGLRASFTP